MTRQKNGTWKLTEEEMRTFVILAYEAAENYDKMHLDSLAQKTREIRKSIIEARDNKKTGFVVNAE